MNELFYQYFITYRKEVRQVRGTQITNVTEYCNKQFVTNCDVYVSSQVSLLYVLFKYTIMSSVK